ncbi:MAG: PilZ domain-containing protein [Deltaproteobacteria bacterium]|nr:PilZ domain-containing protein [Deltaproteobacteria bacterium]
MNTNLDQRRRTERVQYRGVAHLRAAGEPEGLPAEVHNLSAHGMFVRAPRVPSPGVDVSCHVFLGDESCVFSGKIAWAHSGNTPIPEAGIEFVDLSLSERSALQRVLVKSDGPVVVMPTYESDTERIELAPRVISRLSNTGRYGVAGGLLGIGLMWAFARQSSTSAPSPTIGREPITAIRPRVSPLSSLPISRLHEFPFEREVTSARTIIRIAFKGSDRDGQVYRLLTPVGIAARLPAARVPAASQGHFALGTDGVRHVWVEMREGVLYARVLPDARNPVSAVIHEDQIVFTVDRTPATLP